MGTLYCKFVEKVAQYYLSYLVQMGDIEGMSSLCTCLNLELARKESLCFTLQICRLCTNRCIFGIFYKNLSKNVDRESLEIKMFIGVKLRM
jgi:hypothetical protein